ncbi:D-aminoacylase [bacterium]|nr:D-aminoacylase [bacterium]
MVLDLLLSGGTVIDGSGAQRRPADVGVTGGRVVAVGDLAGAEAKLQLDCAGQVVCPGFIDLHSHSDLTLLQNPRAESKVHMGVTSECNGQCGMGVFPIRPGAEAQLRAICSFIEADVEFCWRTPAEYLEVLRQAQTSVNVAPMLGQSALRAFAMGFANRPATAAEIDAMRAAAREGFAAGAVGISLGLAYALGSFASRDELVGLCREAAAHGAEVSVHTRNEGVRQLPALEEMIGIALEAMEDGPLRLQIDHLKCSGKASWGNMPQALERIEQARDEGLDIAFDVYPYTAGSRHLSGSLPAWMHDGGNDALVGRLRDPECRQRLRDEFEASQRDPGIHNPFELSFADILVTDVGSEANRWAVGLRLSEVAERRRQDPLEATLDLLAEEQAHVSVCLFSMNEDDMKLALAHPLGCVATDGLAFAPYGALAKGRPHPRSYGTYPRLLGHYVREEKLLSLPEAIRKCTSLPASRLALTDRGLLREGYAADITVFDPETIADRATYADPHQYPVGVAHVIVNGALTVTGDKHTGAGAGVVL